MKAKIQSSKLFSRVNLIIFALIFALAGTYLIFNSFAAQTGQGKTYYVSPNGTGDGSAESKPSKFSSIASLPVAGDTVIFLDGLYNGTYTITKGGTATDSLVTYKSKNKWGAILDGQSNYLLGQTGNIPNGFTLNANFVKIQDFEIKNYSYDTQSSSGIEIDGGDGNNAVIVGNNIHDIGRNSATHTNGQVGIYINGENATIEQNYIHDIGRNPTKDLDHGIYMNSGNNHTVKNNVFKNILKGYAVQMYPNKLINASVNNNTFINGNPNKNGASITTYRTVIEASSISNNIFYNDSDISKSNEAIEINNPTWTNFHIDNNLSNGKDMYFGQNFPTSGTGNTQVNNSFISATEMKALFVDPNANTPEGYAIKSSAPSQYQNIGATGFTSSSASSTPSICPDKAASKCRPYDDASPWNTVIPTNATPYPDKATSDKNIKYLTDLNKELTSDVTTCTIPVYTFNDSTPRANVTIYGNYREYKNGDNSQSANTKPAPNVAIPAQAAAEQGCDGQIEFWNPVTGEQFGFWLFGGSASTGYHAQNGYHYFTKPGNYGRFAGGLAGRGAGTPYLAGLVRPWEIYQEEINHALAFAYSEPCCGDNSTMPASEQYFLYPAAKTDGGSSDLNSAPEGTRFQLDPTLSDADIKSLGCTGACLTIAHALQKYGMYSIDNSGSSKIYLEDNSSAKWDLSFLDLTGADKIRNLPSSLTPTINGKRDWSRFRVVAPPCDPTKSACTTPTPTPKLPGDVDGNKVVDIDDLSLLLINWKKNYPQADFVKDNIIDIDDLSILLVNWGKKI